MLAPPEAVALGAFLTSLQGSNLPIRRPSWTDPSFWSLPLIKTKVRPIAAGATWADFLTVSGEPQYIAVVSHYTVTTVGDPAVAGLEFRLRLNGMPLPLDAVQLAPGVEFGKTSPTSYPTIPRELFQPVLQTQELALQVRNPTLVQRMAIGAFWGWYYESLDSEVFTGAEQGMTDSIYGAQTGAPYG